MVRKFSTRQVISLRNTGFIARESYTVWWKKLIQVVPNTCGYRSLKSERNEYNSTLRFSITFDIPRLTGVIRKNEHEVNHMSNDYIDLGHRLKKIFAEIESDIIVDLQESSEEYATLHRQLSELKTKYPAICKLLEGSDEISLTTEEHAALRQIAHLRFRLGFWPSFSMRYK